MAWSQGPLSSSGRASHEPVRLVGLRTRSPGAEGQARPGSQARVLGSQLAGKQAFLHRICPLPRPASGTVTRAAVPSHWASPRPPHVGADTLQSQRSSEEKRLSPPRLNSPGAQNTRVLVEGAKRSSCWKDGCDKAQEAERRESDPRPPRLLCPAADSSVFTLVPFSRQTWPPWAKESSGCRRLRMLGWKEGSQKFLEAEGKLPPQKVRKGDPEDAPANRCLRPSTLHAFP